MWRTLTVSALVHRILHGWSPSAVLARRRVHPASCWRAVPSSFGPRDRSLPVQHQVACPELLQA
jgi:hypothetical protein